MSRGECLTTPSVVLALIASVSGSGHVHREFLRPALSILPALDAILYQSSITYGLDIYIRYK